VDNTPNCSPFFTISEPQMITYIDTYHWNYGTGALGGTIGLRKDDGTLYGPWEVETTLDKSEVPKGYWIAHPNEVIPAGSYIVEDSDPSTWSQNSESPCGFTKVEGYAKKKEDITVESPVVPSDLDPSVVEEFEKNGIVISDNKIDPTTLGGGATDEEKWLRIDQVSLTPLYKKLNGGNTVYAMLVAKNIGERPLEHGVISVIFRSGPYSFGPSGEGKCPTIQPGEVRRIPLIIPTAAPKLNKLGNSLVNNPPVCDDGYSLTIYIAEWMEAGWYKERGTFITNEEDDIKFTGCCHEPHTAYQTRDCERSYDPVTEKWSDE
jgi:hypothetical protein